MSAFLRLALFWPILCSIGFSQAQISSGDVSGVVTDPPPPMPIVESHGQRKATHPASTA
jgi:hypothetical protein